MNGAGFLGHGVFTHEGDEFIKAGGTGDARRDLIQQFCFSKCFLCTFKQPQVLNGRSHLVSERGQRTDLLFQEAVLYDGDQDKCAALTVGRPEGKYRHGMNVLADEDLFEVLT
ncbi:hypothetical protein SDC9_71388 [bioreactor metagenome]|uniref:Uncharacterized protein n=1 Tax=bioreactor metagenome TaxID=1076179 RepID=A0A644Y8V7_9ZZZZ